MSHPVRDAVLASVLRVLLEVGGRLPIAVDRFLGRIVMRFLFLFLRRDRRRMRSHISTAFPDYTDAEVRRLTRRCVDHFGCVLGEVAWLWRARAEEVERLVELEGVEHLTGPIERGTGVILFTGHIGNWELLNARMSIAGVPYTLAVRELDDPRMNRIITGLRTKFGARVILRGQSAGRELLRRLREGDGVGLLIDQDIPRIPGVFVPFFGSLARTPSGAAMLALKRGCPFVPGFIHRKPDGTHKIVVSPPLPHPTEGSPQDRVEALTAAATAAIEWHVRAWPEQWVWMHRRWRSRPEAEGVGVSEAVGAGAEPEAEAN
jgi:KDO2-lipid IV(A) lauroyltransferase